MGYITNRPPLFRSNMVQINTKYGIYSITNRPHHFVEIGGYKICDIFQTDNYSSNMDISTFSMPFSKLNEKTKAHSMKFSIIYNNVLL